MVAAVKCMVNVLVRVDWWVVGKMIIKMIRM